MWIIFEYYTPYSIATEQKTIMIMIIITIFLIHIALLATIVWQYISYKNSLFINKYTVILYYYGIFHIWGVCLHFEPDQKMLESPYLFHPYILLKISNFEVILFGGQFGRPLIFLAFYHFHTLKNSKINPEKSQNPLKNQCFLELTSKFIFFIIKFNTKSGQKSYPKFSKYPVNKYFSYFKILSKPLFHRTYFFASYKIYFLVFISNSKRE